MPVNVTIIAQKNSKAVITRGDGVETTIEPRTSGTYTVYDDASEITIKFVAVENDEAALDAE